MGSTTYSRKLRLLTPSHFENVFKKATAAPTPSITFLARTNPLEHPRLGITVSKKNVRNASDRNRIKRLIRESFRLHQETLPNVDIVVVVKKGLAEQENPAIHTLLRKQWKKLTKRCNSSS